MNTQSDENTKPAPMTVVVTGGIASGKSTVSAHFEKLGVPVIDADIIARNLVVPGQIGLKKIAQVFGEEFILSGGTLDRKKMRVKIFNDPAAKKQLESILHPLIEEDIKARLQSIHHPYCILVIPLYAESKGYNWVDRILVVDTRVETQLERLVARDGIDLEYANKILSAQATRTDRLRIADDIISNGGNLEKLKIETKKMHEKFLELAES